jgi:4-oxalocrotonate tautomerase
MPVVTIQVTREGAVPGASSVTAEEKAVFIKGASQLLLDVLNKPLDATYVIIEEVDRSNWGWDGLPTLEAIRDGSADGALSASKTIPATSYPRTRTSPMST